MRISVLSPSFSFSTFCPDTDWKLIFTMAASLSLSLSVCVSLFLCVDVCAGVSSPALCTDGSTPLAAEQTAPLSSSSSSGSPPPLSSLLPACFCLSLPEVCLKDPSAASPHNKHIIVWTLLTATTSVNGTSAQINSRWLLGDDVTAVTLFTVTSCIFYFILLFLNCPEVH